MGTVRAARPGAPASSVFAMVKAKRRLDDKPGEVQIGPENRIVIETPGAGGYGAPGERAANAVEEDLHSGKFSQSYIQRHYAGVESER